ncbi:hypothetical protein CAPTEDRAFT_5084 [Capitella teleta]|uniref:DNA-directed DNA polymerase n=1 Tax=Capitella teleta TaxID=283909 RepID=R7U6N1_CAPTE|nr:hypothetical protein CAPTEDRAFT_5084 [Capitella teleta]|eukprot:ELT99301.1 hypothetical protein CAPTEDRAFT_5084 [Capitella teleta]
MIADELDFWEHSPGILEVDLEYSKDLHNLHNDHPLAPKGLRVNKVDKLVPNLIDKTKYVIHYENLKLCESLGLKITKIHKGIKFEESAWLKQYIDLNTNLRAKAHNEFEKDFIKLMNNSIFGKTMENIKKRVDIRLVNNEIATKKLAAKPNYKHCNIFYENLVAIQIQKTKLVFNQPVYLAMCILDLSKTLIMEKKLNCSSPIQTAWHMRFINDFYKDISGDVANKLDTSNFPKIEGHFVPYPSGIKTGQNKKVVGTFKDEAGGEIIEKFVDLRAKLYSYKMLQGKEEKKCKEVKKPVVQASIRFEDYKTCLSRVHEVYTEEINKIAFSANDDKRVILEDGIHTLAHMVIGGQCSHATLK